jgi:hypothetical protein
LALPRPHERDCEVFIPIAVTGAPMPRAAPQTYCFNCRCPHLLTSMVRSLHCSAFDRSRASQRDVKIIRPEDIRSGLSTKATSTCQRHLDISKESAFWSPPKTLLPYNLRRCADGTLAYRLELKPGLCLKTSLRSLRRSSEAQVPWPLSPMVLQRQAQYRYLQLPAAPITQSRRKYLNA